MTEIQPRPTRSTHMDHHHESILKGAQHPVIREDLYFTSAVDIVDHGRSRPKAFAGWGICGIRAFGWQIDHRPDGWLPLSVRNGKRKLWVLPLGRLGCVTVGKVRSFE